MMVINKNDFLNAVSLAAEMLRDSTDEEVMRMEGVSPESMDPAALQVVRMKMDRVDAFVDNFCERSFVTEQDFSHLKQVLRDIFDEAEGKLSSDFYLFSDEAYLDVKDEFMSN